MAKSFNVLVPLFLTCHLFYSLYLLFNIDFTFDSNHPVTKLQCEIERFKRETGHSCHSTMSPLNCKFILHLITQVDDARIRSPECCAIMSDLSLLAVISFSTAKPKG